MTDKERKSCIQTVELLRRLAFNVHGVMDIIDAQNVDKIIEMLEEPESCDIKTENVLNSNWTVYGDRVKAELETQGITTRELADRLNITPITMSRYLRGERIPRGPVIAQTATVLNVTCDYLIGLSDDPHKTSEGIDMTNKDKEATDKLNKWMNDIGLSKECGKDYCNIKTKEDELTELIKEQHRNE